MLKIILGLLLAAVVILVVVLFSPTISLYLLNQGKATTIPITLVPNGTGTTSNVSAKNATYTIDGTPVTLVDGVSEVPAAPGSASMISTRYFGNEVSYDFNADGRLDTAFLITQSQGGTGTFYYVVAALNFQDGYRGSVALLLGDRIAPQSTKINSDNSRVGVIEVNYADRRVGDSFAATPSIAKTLLLKFDPSTMQFGTVEPSFEGEASTSAMKLDQKKWQFVKTAYINGSVFVPKKIDGFSLTFSKDGKIAVTTDCNNMGGSYIAKGADLVFGTLTATRMFCDGSEEATFAEGLSQVASYQFTSKGELELGLKSGAGSMIFK